jgi:hypothetical protein
LIDPEIRPVGNVQDLLDRRRQTISVCPRDLEQTICWQSLGNPLAVTTSPRADQHGCDVGFMTALVKIVKIQSVVGDLIHVCSGKDLFADLELEDEDYWPNDDDGVDSTAHAWDGEFKIDSTRLVRQNALEDCGLLQPRFPLSSREVKVVCPSHSSEDLVRIARTELRERGGIIRPLRGSAQHIAHKAAV